MKKAVDGRRDVALLDWRELAKSADVPPGWLWNVLKGQVLHRLDPTGSYQLRFEDGLVWVEPTFGQELVSLE